MQFIALSIRGLYVWHPQHGLYWCPSDHSAGYPVAYIGIEARSLRNRAAELREDGKRRLARRLGRAAAALEALDDLPTAA